MNIGVLGMLQAGVGDTQIVIGGSRQRTILAMLALTKTGDPIEVAKVLRDLALLKTDKNLSFGERKMFDQARSLLVQEISVAKDTDEKSIEEEIDGIFTN